MPKGDGKQRYGSGKPKPTKSPRKKPNGTIIYKAGEDPNESLTNVGHNVFSKIRSERFCSTIVMSLFMYFILNFDTEIRPVHYSLFGSRKWPKMVAFHVSIKGQKIPEHRGRRSWPLYSFFLVMDKSDGLIPILAATLPPSIAFNIKIAKLNEYNINSDDRDPPFLFNFWIILEAIIRIIRIMGLPFLTHPNQVIRDYFEIEPYEDTVFNLWASCVWAIALKLPLHPSLFLTNKFHDDINQWFLHHQCLSANLLCMKPTGPGQMKHVPEVEEVNA